MHLSPARPAAAAAFSDCELVDAIRSGDQAAFTALYERYFDRVYHFAYARLRQHADAEEVAQETFVAVFRSIDAFVGRSALLSWIYGIAKNTVNRSCGSSEPKPSWCAMHTASRRVLPKST